MAKSDLKVVGVVGGGNLNATRAKRHIGVFVTDDGNGFVYDGQYNVFDD
jgi:hypothetical protein